MSVLTVLVSRAEVAPPGAEAANVLVFLHFTEGVFTLMTIFQATIQITRPVAYVFTAFCQGYIYF